MSMTVLVIAVACLSIINIVGMISIMATMYRQYDNLINEREKFTSNFLDHLGLFFDGLRKKDEQQKAVIEDILKQNDALKEQYESLEKVCEHMSERYTEICEHYSKLLSCWAGVEERYSDCYEQLKYQNEDCPALNMYCTAIGDDPGDCRYSNLAYDPIGDDK